MGENKTGRPRETSPSFGHGKWTACQEWAATFMICADSDASDDMEENKTGRPRERACLPCGYKVVRRLKQIHFSIVSALTFVLVESRYPDADHGKWTAFQERADTFMICVESDASIWEITRLVDHGKPHRPSTTGNGPPAKSGQTRL